MDKETNSRYNKPAYPLTNSTSSPQMSNGIVSNGYGHGHDIIRRPSNEYINLEEINERLIKESPEAIIKIVKELVDKNLCWQKYCDNRDREIKMLGNVELKSALDKCAELMTKLSEAESRISFLEDQNMAMKEQMQAYVEDFASERKDREQAQSRLVNAESELESLRRDLHRYQLQEMQSMSQRRQAAFAQHRREYERNHPCYTAGPMIEADGEEDMEGEDVVDSGLDSLPGSGVYSLPSGYKTSYGVALVGRGVTSNRRDEVDGPTSTDYDVTDGPVSSGYDRVDGPKNTDNDFDVVDGLNNRNIGYDVIDGPKNRNIGYDVIDGSKNRNIGYDVVDGPKNRNIGYDVIDGSKFQSRESNVKVSQRTIDISNNSAEDYDDV